MNQEPDRSEPISPEKLLIDKPSDFLFHAAYLTYSETFDKTASPEGRRLLNQNITALQQNQIDYRTFYDNINQYRGHDGPQHRFARTIIRTQKKKEWRRKTQKHERVERHKK